MANTNGKNEENSKQQRKAPEHTLGSDNEATKAQKTGKGLLDLLKGDLGSSPKLTG